MLNELAKERKIVLTGFSLHVRMSHGGNHEKRC